MAPSSKFRLGGLIALRGDIGLALLVFWIVLGLLATHLNGGRGPIHDPTALALWVLACSGMSAFMLLTLVSSSWRNAVISDKRRDLYKPGPFLVAASITGVMALIALGGALFELFGGI
jgi:hypothetical protein